MDSKDWGDLTLDQKIKDLMNTRDPKEKTEP